MFVFSKICLLCLEHSNDLIKIKTFDKDGIFIYNKIKTVFPLMVNKQSHQFPVWICTKCLEQINHYYYFKLKCYKTYKLLRKYTMQLNAANRGEISHNFPNKLFEKIKPSSERNVICIDEEPPEKIPDDSITIVKHEITLDIKNEPCSNVDSIQKVIDQNYRTINDIISVKIEPNPPAIEIEEIRVEKPTNPVKPVQRETPKIDERNKSLPARFDYSNENFEEFAAKVSQNITIDKINTTSETQDEEMNNSSNTRVLRKRKSIPDYNALLKSYPKKTKSEIEPQKVKILSPKNNLNVNTEKTFKKRKTYPCEICGRAISSAFNLRRHLKTHRKKLFLCQICLKTCQSQDSLILHEQVMHGIHHSLCT